MIKHPVWPTEVPPVPSGLWNQNSWNYWNWPYRPTNYHGDPFSNWDWMLYQMHKDNNIVIKFYMEFEK